MLLVIFGGMLGVIAGAAGFYLNTRLFRSQINPLLKYALTALISILALILYLVMAIVFVNTIGS
jgi:hypothetical protein